MPAAAINPRKKPVQRRSTQLVSDILQAAIRVLERDGPQKFTTIRVAKAAGVSVGSLYQYFPNKQAILYRLQVDEWERTGRILDQLLADPKGSPAARLRAMLRFFFQSEQEEVPIRLALDSAAPNWNDATESRAARERFTGTTRAFVAEVAPHATPRPRNFAAELLFTTAISVGKRLSETKRSRADIDKWANEVAAMLMRYLEAI